MLQKSFIEMSNTFDWSRVDSALEDACLPFTPARTAAPLTSLAAVHEAPVPGSLAQGSLGERNEPQGTVTLAARKKHAFPGAVLLVSVGGEPVYHKAFGCRSIVPDITPMSTDMVFDIASLTKALVTTTLTMQLVDSGQLSIDKRLSHIFQTFSIHGKERMTIRHLLNHTSGYPAHFPFYKVVAQADRAERAGIMASRGAVEMVINEIFRAKLENLPGKVTKYSDIGFILLGRAIEIVCGGMLLDRLAAKQIFQPLGLKSMAFIDLSKIRRRGLEPVTEMIVPTAVCNWRNRLLCAEVHDDNAYVMGGIAGHAGIFSTALDVHVLATELVRCYHGQGRLVSRETIRRFWTRDAMDPKSSWALGWDTPNPVGSSAGRYFSEKAVGHLGFTGCSLWIEPEEEIVAVLLSNRIHPSIENENIKEFRPRIHDLVREALGAAG